MLKRLIRVSAILAFVPIVSAVGGATATHASTCTSTGFFRDGIDMTAALINAAATVSGPVSGAGCNIVIYYGSGSTGKVSHADLSGANYFGVVNDGGSVTVADSSIHDIGETPLDGTQHGLAVSWLMLLGISTERGPRLPQEEEDIDELHGAAVGCSLLSMWWRDRRDCRSPQLHSLPRGAGSSTCRRQGCKRGRLRPSARA